MAVEIKEIAEATYTGGDRMHSVRAIESYQYPLSIQGEPDRHPNYLVFYAVEAKGGGLNSGSIDARSVSAVSGHLQENTKAIIQLYMPNMVENVNHGYEANNPTFLQDLFTEYNIKSEAGAGWLTGMASAAFSVASDKLDVARDSIRQHHNANVTGQVLGSRASAMYKSSAPRQQTFLFQFRPRNKSELEQVGNILKSFLVYSSSDKSTSYKGIGGTGSQTGGYSKIDVPHLWFVEERINGTSTDQQGIRYTPKFAMGPAAVSNIRMNKTPDQVYESFKRTGGDPIAIDLEITLTELRPIFADYWRAVCKHMGKPNSLEGEFMFGSFGDSDSEWPKRM